MDGIAAAKLPKKDPKMLKKVVLFYCRILSSAGAKLRNTN